MRIWTSLGAAVLTTMALAACGETTPADSGTGAPRLTAAGPGRTAQPPNDQQAGHVAALSGRLETLRQSIARETQAYNAAIGTINDRLQAGTTPANRDLVTRWNEAQGNLDVITADLGRLNALAADVAQQTTAASNMPSAPRTIGASRRPARTIDGETNRAVQDLNRLKGEVDSEIARQNSFLQTERPTLANLGYAINTGRLGPTRTAGSVRR